MTASRRWLVGAASTGVVIAGIGLFVVLHGGASDGGYRVTMRPASALSPTACKAEMRALHIPLDNGGCPPSRGQPWFRFTVTNVHDNNGNPVCQATAYDRSGRPLFERDVPIYIVGGVPSGPSVQRGTSLRLTWFFDVPSDDPSYVQRTSWMVGEIIRYSATCHGRPTSQVPF